MKNKLFYFCGIMMPQNYFSYYSGGGGGGVWEEGAPISTISSEYYYSMHNITTVKCNK
jgi:hypothetical protein